MNTQNQATKEKSTRTIRFQDGSCDVSHGHSDSLLSNAEKEALISALARPAKPIMGSSDHDLEQVLEFMGNMGN